MLDFAVIGHQESWQKAADFVNGIRNPSLGKLSIDQVKDVFPYFPPCDVFRVKVQSIQGNEINGMYIETFIEPDKLDEKNIRTNITKVKNAMAFANKKAKVVSLGGFTSIVLEGKLEPHSTEHTKFSTGNTLTAAYIVKAVEKYAQLRNLKLNASNIMIIGASGDIGMACVTYFKKKVSKLLLCARNKNNLEALAQILINENVSVSYSQSPSDLSPEADVIISVASSSNINLGNCKEGVLICDAGYPKNIETNLSLHPEHHIFHGGMGRLGIEAKFEPDYSKTLYQLPVSKIIHGCILESMVLAFEQRHLSYSTGKGNISMENIEEIYQAGVKHGINLAPFYNSNGLVD